MGRGDVADVVKAGGQSALDGPLQAPVPETTSRPLQRSTLEGRINMANVTPEPVVWIWEGRIARGKLTLIDGDPGEGKSLLTLDLAARLSTGRPMPLETTAPQTTRKTLFLLCEDDLKDTVSPRLIAADADRSQIEVVTDLLSIPGQLDAIERHVCEVDATLLVLDPLNGYLDAKLNTYNDHQVRSALLPLAKLAERLNVAIVGIRHLTKQSGGRAKYRGGGSIGYIGVARSALMVGIDPEDPDARILALSKSNVAKEPPSLRFRIIETNEKQPRIHWIETCDVSAERLCAAPESAEEQSAIADAKDFLRERLSDGPKQTADLYQLGKEQQIAVRTLRRAARALKIPKGRTWALPAATVAAGELGR